MRLVVLFSIHKFVFEIKNALVDYICKLYR